MGSVMESVKNSEKSKKMFYTALVIVLVCTILGGAAQVTLKTGIDVVGEINLSDIFSIRIFNIVLNPYIMLGIVLYAISLVLYLFALSRYDVSFVFPLISMSYIFAALFSTIFLGESLPALRWLGIITIVAGVFMVIQT